MTWRQIAFAGYDGFAGLGLKLQACASGDLAAGLGGGFRVPSKMVGMIFMNALKVAFDSMSDPGFPAICL